MRVENWYGYDVRFVEIDSEWWAILKDICDILNLKTYHVKTRLDADTIMRVRIDLSEERPGMQLSTRARRTQDMYVVNEIGIYEALFASRKPEAREFRQWASEIMNRLREQVGLEEYEALRMTDQDIQDEIDYRLGDPRDRYYR